MDNLELIETIATVLSKTEIFIEYNSTHFLPEKHAQFIDMCTLNVAKYQNDFLSYDVLKNIVTTMVNRHISASPRWFVDMTNTTSNDVFLINEEDYSRIKIPVSHFLVSHGVSAFH